MTPIVFKIMLHSQNQHGWPVSLTKWNGEELEQGFTLISCESKTAQAKYTKELVEMTGWEVLPAEF